MKSTSSGKTHTRSWIVPLVLFAIVFLAFFNAGKFLVVNNPQPSDVILVLAGETDRRPTLALQLLSEGYAKRVILDVPARAKIYDFTQLELADKYLQDLPQRAAVSVCPIEGLSTRDESRDVKKCIADQDVNSILIVTSDFHTRRALSVFRRQIPDKTYSIAAAHDNGQFGVRWWTHRQWAKVCFEEWLRLSWWMVVDRWRQ